MRILKILSAIACFALAALLLIIVALMLLAWSAQYSMNTAKTPDAPVSIHIGPLTLIGWQIKAAISLLATLAITFAVGGIYTLKKSKAAA